MKTVIRSFGGWWPLSSIQDRHALHVEPLHFHYNWTVAADSPPDFRTPAIRENPPVTLEIVEARRPPPGAGLSLELNGYHYAVRPQSGYQWNKKAFSLLYQLFQMSVSTVAQTGPAITISK